MKRLISLMLAVVILISVASVGSFAVSADSEMHTSQACIDMLKQYEGFSKYPYWDYGQYTVGYGTRCPDDMYTYYKENGITEEEAEILLQNFLSDFELDIHEFADKYGLTFTQNQFDALILFSYNCGSGWAFNASKEFHQAVANGATGDEMIYRFSQWCSAGGSILTALIRRRLCEANLYINGEYSTTVPSNYCYVIYNANGGSVTSRVQGYNSDSSVEFASTATYEGYTFLGWYTAKTGGTKVTKLDASVNGKTLYARWEAAEGAGTDDPVEDTNTSVTVTVTNSDVNYRKGPGTNYTILGQKNTGDELVITATAEGNGYTWGQFADGWIALRYTNYDDVKDAQPQEPETTEPEETEPETTEPEETEPETTEPETTEPETTEPEDTKPEEPSSTTVMGTIKVTHSLNIRQKPGTGYAIVGSYKPNARVEILEQKVVGATVWGRTDKGWISMDYVVLDKEESGDTATEPDDSQTSTAVTGVVNSSDFLRIRSGPGTSYSLVGYLYAGDKVTITELKNTGSMTWGKIDKGWISMNYITLDSASDNSGSNDSAVTGETGTIDVNDYLRVRSGPGTSYAVAGYLYAGDKVTITEKKTVGSTVWGKISKGWISLDYVVMDSQGSGTTGSAGSDNSGSGNTTSTQTVTGVVSSSDFLRIRSGPGTSYTHIGYVYAGDKLTITEQKTVNGTVWGKITQGWVSMDYVTLDSQSGSTDTGSTEKVVKTITADCLNVRSAAGTGNSIVGYLYYGAKVEILETKTVNGTVWGRISNGWISMEYTK